MEPNSYLKALSINSNTSNSMNTNILLPDQLTLHEVLVTIRYAGQFLRKLLDPTDQKKYGPQIRSLVTGVVSECAYLQPDQDLCKTMKVIIPGLWYWARADNKDTLQTQNFYDIYNKEGLLLRSFLKTRPLIIPLCFAHNSLLQLFDTFYRNRRLDPLPNKLYYNIPEDILQWRNEKQDWRDKDHSDFVDKWVRQFNDYLVEVPELPPTWVDKDPFKRPVLFSYAIQHISETGPRETSHGTLVRHDQAEEGQLLRHSYHAPPQPNVVGSWADQSELAERNVGSLESGRDYELPVNFLWNDTTIKSYSQVIIARNKLTGKLELFEQPVNPLLPYIAEIIVTNNTTFFNAK